MENGRKVYETTSGEKIFETTSRPADIDFKVWLQNQREGKIANAIINHDLDKAKRIENLSDEELAKELGMAA